MKNILILEDDQIVQMMYKRMLSKTHHLTIVPTVAEAQKHLINPLSFDLFISDMRLPDGTGDEAVLFAQKHRPDLPIFVVSGTIDDAAALNVTRKFEKPFSPEALTEAIDAIKGVSV